MGKLHSKHGKLYIFLICPLNAVFLLDVYSLNSICYIYISNMGLHVLRRLIVVFTFWMQLANVVKIPKVSLTVLKPTSVWCCWVYSDYWRFWLCLMFFKHVFRRQFWSERFYFKKRCWRWHTWASSERLSGKYDTVFIWHNIWKCAVSSWWGRITVCHWPYLHKWWNCVLKVNVSWLILTLKICTCCSKDAFVLLKLISWV